MTTTFDTKTLELLARALDRAWHMLLKTNPPPPENHKAAREALAKHILHYARRGERNEVRLAYFAVARFDR